MGANSSCCIRMKAQVQIPATYAESQARQCAPVIAAQETWQFLGFADQSTSPEKKRTNLRFGEIPGLERMWQMVDRAGYSMSYTKHTGTHMHIHVHIHAYLPHTEVRQVWFYFMKHLLSPHSSYIISLLFPDWSSTSPHSSTPVICML